MLVEVGCNLTVIQNFIDQPLNFKISKLTAFNINNCDRMIEKLRI